MNGKAFYFGPLLGRMSGQGWFPSFCIDYHQYTHSSAWKKNGKQGPYRSLRLFLPGSISHTHNCGHHDDDIRLIAYYFCFYLTEKEINKHSNNNNNDNDNDSPPYKEIVLDKSNVNTPLLARTKAPVRKKNDLDLNHCPSYGP
ncbi:hypothetical protein IF1G_03428 [Cordyceps javanica]|uniref:Uncharacterized protein n=1 Tax=Cordyceps javanica TaxID=43265 RepID=A0A545V7M3_9HYPO|nr:hypothetical protein IF1G_03428 [Cordyceps javanica]